MLSRKPYPTDVSDDEWVFVLPYLTLMTPDAPQREYDLREVFNALRWLARAGAGWRGLIPRETQIYLQIYQSLDSLMKAKENHARHI